MALVILGIAASGVLLPFASGASVQAESMRRTLATRIANDLMERILATPFEDIVATWDYDEGDQGWKYAEPQGQVKDAGDAPYADGAYDRFSRDAACYRVYVPQQLMGLQGWPPAPNFILVLVRVQDQGRQMVTLSRLISQ